MQRTKGDLDTNSAIATCSIREPCIQIATGSHMQSTGSIEIGGAADSSVRYRECLKNHAANMGTHVLDGCGEFMPSGEEGTPDALKCAACDCHRSFHRREINGQSQYVGSFCYTRHINNSRIGRRDVTLGVPKLNPGFLSQPSIQQHHGRSLGLHNSPTYRNLAAIVTSGGGRVTAEPSNEDLSMYQLAEAVQTSGQPPLKKKRFRTKFTKEQKDKMMEYAEKLGWKIDKQEEQQVQQFCSELGVKRQAFIVWMHNNKQVLKRRQM